MQIYENNCPTSTIACTGKCNEPALHGVYRPQFLAGVAKLADARDLGSRIERCAGSSPVSGTYCRAGDRLFPNLGVSCGLFN